MRCHMHPLLLPRPQYPTTEPTPERSPMNMSLGDLSRNFSRIGDVVLRT